MIKPALVICVDILFLLDNLVAVVTDGAGPDDEVTSLDLETTRPALEAGAVVRLAWRKYYIVTLLAIFADNVGD